MRSTGHTKYRLEAGLSTDPLTEFTALPQIPQLDGTSPDYCGGRAEGERKATGKWEGKEGLCLQNL